MASNKLSADVPPFIPRAYKSNIIHHQHNENVSNNIFPPYVTNCYPFVQDQLSSYPRTYQCHVPPHYGHISNPLGLYDSTRWSTGVQQKSSHLNALPTSENGTNDAVKKKKKKKVNKAKKNSNSIERKQENISAVKAPESSINVIQDNINDSIKPRNYADVVSKVKVSSNNNFKSVEIGTKAQNDSTDIQNIESDSKKNKNQIKIEPEHSNFSTSKEPSKSIAIKSAPHGNQQGGKKKKTCSSSTCENKGNSKYLNSPELLLPKDNYNCHVLNHKTYKCDISDHGDTSRNLSQNKNSHRFANSQNDINCSSANGENMPTLCINDKINDKSNNNSSFETLTDGKSYTSTKSYQSVQHCGQHKTEKVRDVNVKKQFRGNGKKKEMCSSPAELPKTIAASFNFNCKADNVKSDSAQYEAEFPSLGLSSKSKNVIDHENISSEELVPTKDCGVISFSDILQSPAPPKEEEEVKNKESSKKTDSGTSKSQKKANKGKKAKKSNKLSVKAQPTFEEEVIDVFSAKMEDEFPSLGESIKMSNSTAKQNIDAMDDASERTKKATSFSDAVKFTAPNSKVDVKVKNKIASSKVDAGSSKSEKKVSKGKKAKKSNKPTVKSKQNIEIDILDLFNQTQKPNKKKQVKLSSAKFLAKKENVRSVKKVPHNMLDSTSPLKKRGKEREVPKKKKPTKMKQVILKERAKNCQQRLQKEDQGDQQHLQKEDQDKEVPQQAEDNKLKFQNLENIQRLKDSCPPADAKSHFHSRGFRDYCNQFIISDINKFAKNLLEDLVRFQDRNHQRDPVKAKAKRRIVLGLREVTKHVNVGKIKCLIMAPNLEKIKSEGGLDDAVHKLIDLAEQKNIPVVFALKKNTLGRICKKYVAVSCIGIFNYDGSEENFKQMINLMLKQRSNYQESLNEFERKPSGTSEKLDAEA